MPIASSAAAQASWMSRRMRVAGQQLATTTTSATDHSNTRHSMIPPVVGGSSAAAASKFLRARMWDQPTPCPTVRPEWLAPVQPKEPTGTGKRESIQQLTELISNKISEKFADDASEVERLVAELNADMFWSKYTSVHELAKLEAKEDILKVISTFEFISKKSVYLFSQFSKRIIADRIHYSPGELASVMHAFAQLGFLEEGFCLQLSTRIVEEITGTTNRELVHIADAFASTRCYHSTMIESLLKEAKFRISSSGVSGEGFDAHEVALFLSSMARLNVRDEEVFEKLGLRLVELTNLGSTAAVIAGEVDPSVPTANLLLRDTPAAVAAADVCARDVTLTAYAFAKMKVPTPFGLQSRVVSLTKSLIRDFTAKELQMITTAFDRWNLEDAELYAEISVQTQRRIAQFSVESLVLLLKALSARGAIDTALATRVVCQLPRMATCFKPADLVQFYAVIGKGVDSEAAVNALRASTVAASGQFAPADWISIMSSLANSSCNAESVNEVIDAFVLVNKSPAKYRNSTASINSTVIQRMTNVQLIELTRVNAKLAQPHIGITDLIALELVSRTFSPNDAGDLYCVLVEMNCHNKPEFEKPMRDLLVRSIASE